MRQGAIDTSQAVRDPVQPFISGVYPRGAFRGLPRGFKLCVKLPKRRKTWACPLCVFRCSRPTRSGTAINSSTIALVFTGIGTNILSTCPRFPLLRPQSVVDLGHYMMQPRGKNSITSCPQSQWPIHTNGSVPCPRDLPSRCIKQTFFLCGQ